MRIYVDCDPGIDDALALAYLTARPEVELVGVGSVFGNNDAATTTGNALRLLELYGRPEVPVARGAGRGLAQPARSAKAVHGENGLGEVELPEPAAAPTDHSAAELLVRGARSTPGEIDVLALGPLTNLALALSIEPELPDLLGRVVIMGGAVRAPGNITPWAEANVAADPEAAEAVLGAGFDATLVALDVTMRTVATDTWLDGLAGIGGRRAETTAEFLRFYTDWYTRVFGVRQCAMHDPLAAAVLLTPELATATEEVPVRVELQGAHTRGQTIADLRPNRDTADLRPPVTLVRDVDGEAFFKRMADALR
ncbi:nucleoside hydrolase [Streptomonospora litoralis]|uniref:Pyrimidine-specific ribonucleoside hydrolase RihA n=1 Tax=Streptomonospora litoralis TaxID=2498135 RepID=A0A4P6Q130_9ACTN|nr:nucleoside hydrolase [Streptomonospora litoralis]QBI52404.1 Pyrimidine-specific ribonucleoside hydrolase RihA [Streptomonospora litoralis]